MPTKAYFPRSDRYIDGADRSRPKPSRIADLGTGSGGRAPKRRGSVAEESVALHAPPAAAAHSPTAHPAPQRPSSHPSSHPSSRPSSRPGPHAPSSQSQAVAVGDWLWACRAGAEPDLCDELATYGLRGRELQPGLCASSARPRTAQKEDAELTFARQGLPVQLVAAAQVPELAAFIAELFADRRQAQKGSGLALHVFAPDSDAGNMLAATVLELHERLAAALFAAGIQLLPDARTAHAEGGKLAQVCLLAADRVAVGVLPARAAPSQFPGGRQRFKKPKDAPARSALKLTEALAWLGHGPQAGEVCVDLGAAPGGWSQVLLERRCHVVAIDPGRLAPHLAGRLEHLRTNAFTFEPELPADWVLCDMAYRPLEVAGLLAKWGRRRWAQFLLANIKLPMNRRVAMLARVREILTTGGWTGLRMRQLYHDRDEVTLAGWRGFGVDTRVQRGAASDLGELASESGPERRPPRGGTGSDKRLPAAPGHGRAGQPPKPKASRGRAAVPSRAAAGAPAPKAPPSRGRAAGPPKPARGGRKTPTGPSGKSPRPRR